MPKLIYENLILKGDEKSFWPVEFEKITWLGGDANWRDHGGRFSIHTGLGLFKIIRIEPGDSWDENFTHQILEESIWLDNDLLLYGMKLIHDTMDIDKYFNSLSFMQQVKIILFELLVEEHYVDESFTYESEREFKQALKAYGLSRK